MIQTLQPPELQKQPGHYKTSTTLKRNRPPAPKVKVTVTKKK